MILTSDFVTALSPERKIIFSLGLFGGNFDSSWDYRYVLWDKKLGILFRSGRSEILNPFPAMFLGGSEILNLLLCSLGDQKLWILFCAFEGDQRFSILLCIFVGDQKFWILLCVIVEDQKFWISGGSEILNPFLCSLGIGNSESFVVLFGDQKFGILRCILRGSEILNSPLCCLGDQKFWILSCVAWGISRQEIPKII